MYYDTRSAGHSISVRIPELHKFKILFSNLVIFSSQIHLAFEGNKAMYACSDGTRFPDIMHTTTDLKFNLRAIQLRFQPLIKTVRTQRE